MKSGAPIIMTVDDESSVRRIIRVVLEREGFGVREASSGPEALDLMAQEPEIALVLSDMRMPGMDGNALAHRLLAVRPDIRLMFVSGFHTDLDECFRNCPTLTKPFNGKELVSRVRMQLTRSAQA